MKKIAFISTAIVLVILGRLWLGVYHHDEFAETHLFIKHRPTWKWTFYSPIGMSDKKVEDLSIEQKKEQLLFEEFISSKGMSK
ncbi:hypothetical protein C8N40_10393 [Pontibacter mucosus]|uniref:Uncharacterized protein n=1 Tax=Pontibacter mucosus TaxID=1649266 RepID=A0A2T5YL37_9BACT|nr:hypothetical protein [Pontibacter mucosus]PTX20021.1 hypothetical protein C8N40_10393 [Pontibacter mucosus]